MKTRRLAWRRVAMGALAAALLGGFVLVLARSGPLAPVRVTTAEAAQGQVAPELFGIGTVEARRSYLIGPTVAGRVAQVRVDVGEMVRAGEVLAEMDPVDTEQRIASLAAAVERARSAVAVAQAQHRDAQARKALAELNVQRYVDLGQQQFVSSSAVDAKRQEQASALAGVQGAQAGVASARQELQRLQAEHEALREQRDNLRLRAPAAAIVTAREAEPGSTVVAGQAVLRLAEPASLWLRVRFDQARSDGLALGLPAEVRLRSRPEQPLRGKVVRVEPLADSVTEERVAQVALDEAPASLTLGELAEVSVKLPAAGASLVVPSASLRREGAQVGVWRLRAGDAEFVPVRTGRSSLDGRTQVLHGLAAGDRVVVHSEKPLGRAARVRVVASLEGLTR
ncbi:MAG: efflux RND transporter periplasmic adaptor subunit [Pseudomonadota bacterium]